MAVPDLAAELKLVQSGTAAIASGATIGTATVTAVDMSKSILFFSYSVNNNTTLGQLVAGELSSTTNLNFVRNGNTAVIVPIRWYLAEFNTGVSVVRGRTLINATSVNATLPTPVSSTSKAFSIISNRNDGSTIGEDDFTRAVLINNGTLQLNVQVAGTNTWAYYQVVEWDALNVQRGTISIAAGGTTANATITAVNPHKTMLIADCQTPDGTAANIGQKGYRASLESTTNVLLTRQNSGQAMTCGFQAVEFQDRTSVTHGTTTMASAHSAGTASVGVYANTGKNIPYLQGWRGSCGSSAYSTDDNLGTQCTYFYVNNFDQLMMNRMLTGAVATYGWSMIRFPSRVVKAD